ncbi:MAG: universal stress protein, partial [Deltaproteobacteria bacterium]|nr:universal stress protein [Deltaproteobacteria bacterium]
MDANQTEVEIRKVLWPTDFSSSAKKALPYISSLTAKYGAEIHVLYVVDDVAHHRAWYGEFDKDHIDKLAQRTNESAKNRLNQICDKYLEGCPLYIKHLAVGDPAQEILKLIDKEN